MKTLSVLSVLAVLLFAGCSHPVTDTVSVPGSDHYQVTLIGDIHYDGPQYHIKPLSERARKLHFTQWQGVSQQVLAAAAEQNRENTAFAVQLGDMIQGDCDNQELQGAAYKDAFALLKKYFSGKKLFAVRGNHEHRGVKGVRYAAEKYIVPLVRNELGANIDMDGVNYALRYGRDLYIFYDYLTPGGGKFTAAAIENNPDVRHIFFITHLPMFPCSFGNPGWVVPQFRELIPLLAKHKAVVICAHNHSFSRIVYKCPEGVLTQINVTSMGREWKKGDISNVRHNSYDQWKSNISQHHLTSPRYKWSIENLKFFKNDDFITYRVGWLEPSGFAGLEINGDKVTAHIFTDDSGEPKESWVLKGN